MADFEAVAPKRNPMLDQLVKSQTDLANDFRKNIGANSDKLFNNYQRQSSQALDTSLKDINKDFNRRGLYNSGMRQGARAKSTAQTMVDNSAARYDINQSLLGKANELEQNAVNTGYGFAGLGADLSEPTLQGINSALSNQIANMQYQSQMAGGLLGGIGQGIGTYLGARK